MDRHDYVIGVDWFGNSGHITPEGMDELADRLSAMGYEILSRSDHSLTVAPPVNHVDWQSLAEAMCPRDEWVELV